MTPLETRIAAIKAECLEQLRLSELATDGPWFACVSTGSEQLPLVTNGRTPCFDVSTNDEARFIAHARTVSPAACRAVLAAIDYNETGLLQAIADAWERKS